MNDFTNHRRTGTDHMHSGPQQQFETLVREIINELYANARYWDFFKSFEEDSVHDFISEYAARKAWYQVNGELILKKRNNDALRFREMAERCFWEIQQKKLFNLQAEWRAGLIEIEQIAVTRDFLCWENAIALCPFLEPVTEAEFNLYLDYLDSGFYDEKSWIYSWQDYEVFRNNNASDDVTPAWYQYYDRKMGTGYLMLLPDKVGVQEKRYYETWKSSQKDCQYSKHFQDDFNSRSPVLTSNYQTLDFFIRTFESPRLLKIFQSVEPCPENAGAEAELHDAIRLLRSAQEPVPVPQSGDWKEAIKEAAARFRIQNIRSNLKSIFEEYRFMIANGIIPNDPSDRIEYEERLSEALTYRERILEGRGLMEG